MSVSQESTTNVWNHEVTAVCNSPSLWKRLPATQSRFPAVISQTSGGIDREFRNCEAPILKTACQHTFNQFWRHQGRSATTVSSCTLVRPSVNFLHHPSSDHTGISQLAADSITAVIFFQCCAITTAVTRLKLHCIIPTYSLSTATHVHSRPTSHTISGYCEVHPESKYRWPIEKTQASISEKYLLHYLQRFTGFFSTYSPSLLKHLSYRCINVSITVSQESGVYLQRLEPRNHCRLYLTVV